MLVVLHVACICATGLLVLYADEQALLWVLGTKQRLMQREVRFLHYAVALGLGCVILTGGFLFIPRAAHYFSQPVFIVKMIIVSALVINSAFLDRFSLLAVTQPFAALPRRARIPILASGAASTLCWLAAITCGLLLG